jgi:hypothetical protein
MGKAQELPTRRSLKDFTVQQHRHPGPRGRAAGPGSGPVVDLQLNFPL